MSQPYDPKQGRDRPLPQGLSDAIAGKDAGSVSTRLSEHRTSLSEHRTDMAEHRSGLADLRSHLANERTHLAYLRTAISLIGFGITINRFSVFLQQQGKLALDQKAGVLRSAEHAGAGMVVIGLTLIAWSLYRYWHVNRDIEQAVFRPLHRAVITLTVLLLTAGGFTAAWLFLHS